MCRQEPFLWRRSRPPASDDEEFTEGRRNPNYTLRNSTESSESSVDTSSRRIEDGVASTNQRQPEQRRTCSRPFLPWYQKNKCRNRGLESSQGLWTVHSLTTNNLLTYSSLMKKSTDLTPVYRVQSSWTPSSPVNGPSLVLKHPSLELGPPETIRMKHKCSSFTKLYSFSL